jgi:hypothetical protein
MERSQLNQAEFAQQIGVGASNLSQLLNPKYERKPSEKLVSSILRAYPDINPDWLMFGQGNMLRAESTMMKVIDATDSSSENNTDKSEPPDLFSTMMPTKPGIRPVKPSGSPKVCADASKFEVKIEEKPIETAEQQIVTCRNPTERKIVQIIVYYSDNTFEVFGGGKNT